MNNAEAVNWLINITADIGKIEHQDLWHYEQALSEIREMLEDAPTIEPEPHWIPFKRRKPTEEEGTAFDYIMDCKCPEDGQNILVSINIQGHEPVQYDTFYGGGGEECCLESSYELVEEATAWMPLPEPYKEGE